MGSKLPNPVRLACIRPAASVHPEPGSNSPLYKCFVCSRPHFISQNRNLLLICLAFGAWCPALPPHTALLALRVFFLQFPVPSKLTVLTSFCLVFLLLSYDLRLLTYDSSQSAPLRFIDYSNVLKNFTPCLAVRII
jgi:hypothetical protein